MALSTHQPPSLLRFLFFCTPVRVFFVYPHHFIFISFHLSTLASPLFYSTTSRGFPIPIQIHSKLLNRILGFPFSRPTNFDNIFSPLFPDLHLIFLPKHALSLFLSTFCALSLPCSGWPCPSPISTCPDFCI